MTITETGKNISRLKETMKVSGKNPFPLIDKAKELYTRFPDPVGPAAKRQGLLLGRIQSGKTAGLITTIALAADNGYKLFIVLTSDILLLYQQTLQRLSEDLQGLQIEGKYNKKDWKARLSPVMFTLGLPDSGVVLVSTKNATAINNMMDFLDDLKANLGTLPPTLIIDDEADQASLDTQKRSRNNNPSLAPGTINSLISQMREKFPLHVYLQVTATPQALFLQEEKDPYRPEFTVLIEPGEGYVGGQTFFSRVNEPDDVGKQTFFSLVGKPASGLIRHIAQNDVDNLINTNGTMVPESLKQAICIFYVGATIKYLGDKSQSSFSFLCHISERKVVHDSARIAIDNYFDNLRKGLADSGSPELRLAIHKDLRTAYKHLKPNLKRSAASLNAVLEELKGFIINTDIQVLNSEQKEPLQYTRRYNIFIGGTKLARGVTISNLIVTYYGREPKIANMDTMLQHARMYGYRDKHLDVTRLFVTEDIERRFRLINESEEALRHVVQAHPDEAYRGIYIGNGVRATRPGVLNPNNMGVFAAGTSYYPRLPVYQKSEVFKITERLDAELSTYPLGSQLKPITLEQAIKLIKLTGSNPAGGGLWETRRIVAALEEYKKLYGNQAYLVVRKDAETSRARDTGVLEAILTGGELNRAKAQDATKPILFMIRLKGRKIDNWDDAPFWVPNLYFPDGQYGIIFNFE